MTPITPSGWYSTEAARVELPEARRRPARPQHRRGVLRRPVQVQDRVDDLQRGVVERLARLVVHQLREPSHVPGEVRLPGEQPQLPLGVGEPAPPGGRVARLAHREADLPLPVDAVAGDYLASRG